jgi:hypothetical protein
MFLEYLLDIPFVMGVHKQSEIIDEVATVLVLEHEEWS